ncbi:MAG: hypothetical protein HOO86_00655 [Bacteroidales bacterium]|nr:hypothetical protein [Bacteroidales bacterium]
MGDKKSKKKVKRHKFKQITFKLSERQNKSLMKYCKACNTTPIKVIKRNLERYLGSYEYNAHQELPAVSERQLELFQEEPMN